MNIDKIELTEEESVLLKEISFSSHEYDVLRQSCKNAGNLTLLLLERKVIPKIRIKYFTNPKYNIGRRGKSRQEVFESNGTTGKDILFHGNFLKYLKYFIYGPDLPKAAIQIVCNNIDPEDYPTLTRGIVRDNMLNPKESAEEFYKLFIECDNISFYASNVRKSIMAMKVKNHKSTPHG